MSLTNHRKGTKSSHLPQPSSFGVKEKKRVKLFNKQFCLNSKSKGRKGKSKTRSNSKSY